jgi:uncharacterized protein DUF4288
MTQRAKQKKKIPIRNKSPFGWWIASYLERFEFEDEDKNNLNRRCLAWKNTIIIKARNRDEAFRKAEKIGRLSDGIEGCGSIDRRKGSWRYEGLTMLLPIYEELEDGAEILWDKHENVTVKKVKSWVKGKRDLEAFDDENEAT